jgi:glycosyltransferase involved in cell wall biosynthesis
MKNKLKILYASCRYSPLDRDAGSGVDFNIYEELQNLGVEMKIIGPFKDHPSDFEKAYRQVHRLFSKKLYSKFSEAYLRYCAKMVDIAAEEYQPDAIFTHNLLPLVYSRTSFPVVYKTDSILKNLHPQWPTYSWFELQRMLRWEKAALERSSLVITASDWAKECLLDDYKIPEDRIMVMVIPSSLPEEVIPAMIAPKHIHSDEVRLLLVGRDYDRKGIDIAIDAVNLLNSQGVKAALRVVGRDGEDSQHVRFMGLYAKSDPKQMAEYIGQYQWADLLIHPARFEAAGIVCGEAAAFGVPTITNSSGGLASTVRDGVSGVVLPMKSPAQAYADVVKHFLAAPDEYAKLCVSTRQRYENELNWKAAGKRIYSETCRVIGLQPE